jgi:hypothetical protein
MKIFNFFISNFRGTFQFFPFPYGGMTKCSIQISKLIFFHSSRMANFFLKFNNKKIQSKF